MMPRENDEAPDFTLPTDDGSSLRLSELRGQKVILFFYPRADTPGCTKEACEFRDLTPDIQEKGATILGISPDPIGAVKKFKAKYDLPFTLLADSDHEVAERYGVWVEKTMFGNTFQGVERTTFLVDEEGRIARVYRAVNPEGHAEKVLQGL